MNPPHGYVRQRPDHQSHNYFFSFFFRLSCIFFLVTGQKFKQKLSKIYWAVLIWQLREIANDHGGWSTCVLCD